MKSTARLALACCLCAAALAAPATGARPSARPDRTAAPRPAQAAPRQPPAPQPAQPPAPRQPRDERLWRRALEIHRKAVVVDGHNDITEHMADTGYDIGTPSAGKYHTDLARLMEGGVTGQFFSVYVDRKYAGVDFINRNYVREGGSARRALDLIDVMHRAVERHPDRMMLAVSTADIRRAKRERKVAMLLGIEGGHAIENSLSALRQFYRLGVRYMTLTHNNTNEWADACCDAARHGGLSEFGREVVREMNRLGMFVDVSHVSDETMNDVLDVTTAPVIASHSSARALNGHRRNIPDELLRRIAKNGGVVMVNFYPAFIDERVRLAGLERDERLKDQRAALRERFSDDPARLEEELNKLNAANPLPPAPLSILIDHIDHIAKVAGADHVGLGSDFDGVPTLPVGMEDVSKLPVITYELLRRGYGETDVRKILGGNAMRAFAEVERVAGITRRRVSGDGSRRRLGDASK
ncbi:MAG TPA: dipeptidase [Pyrinomonadaceae bacterium]|nr:dipeptidase [Pyrinomonadaceae bacterium]